MSTVASDLPTTAPLFEGRKSVLEQSLVIAFMIIPVVALAAAVTLTWGWGLTLLDVVIATIAYFGTGLGVTVGFHRHFTHKSFKAARPLKVALAITGSLAFQGSVVSWVADHRRHHAFSDKEGDPHSPWLFGTGPVALARGFWHAHMGWLFDRDQTNAAPVRPRPARRPRRRRRRPAVRAADGGQPRRARAARRPAELVVVGRAHRVLVGRAWCGWALLHHVTWSINSICHMVGPQAVRHPRPLGQRLVAGRALVRRVVAQPAPRRPHVRPARREARPDRHLGPRSSGSSRSSAGCTPCAGRRRSGWSGSPAAAPPDATGRRDRPGAAAAGLHGQAHAHEVAARPLGLVHRRVGDLQERRRGRCASRGAVAPPIDTVSPSTTTVSCGARDGDAQRGDPLPDPLGDRPRPRPRVLAVGPPQQHHELLAAEPADEVVVAHLVAQRRGDGGEHLVADEVAEAVVDQLEVVEVEHEHARGPGRPAPSAGRRGPPCPARRPR